MTNMPGRDPVVPSQVRHDWTWHPPQSHLRNEATTGSRTMERLGLGMAVSLGEKRGEPAADKRENRRNSPVYVLVRTARKSRPQFANTFGYFLAFGPRVVGVVPPAEKNRSFSMLTTRSMRRKTSRASEKDGWPGAAIQADALCQFTGRGDENPNLQTSKSLEATRPAPSDHCGDHRFIYSINPDGLLPTSVSVRWLGWVPVFFHLLRKGNISLEKPPHVNRRLMTWS